MNILYEYRLSGRRPTIWLSGMAFVLMGVLMATYNADPIIWFPVLIGFGMIAWALISNPVNGLRVTDRDLILSPWNRPQTIPLDDIAAVQFQSWSDSDDMSVRLRSGRKIDVSSLDTPPVSTFRTVLEEIAIPVEQR